MKTKASVERANSSKCYLPRSARLAAGSARCRGCKATHGIVGRAQSSGNAADNQRKLLRLMIRSISSRAAGAASAGLPRCPCQLLQQGQRR